MRELLPDWLLSPAYRFRRAFLPRHRRVRLSREEGAPFRLEPARSRLPNGRVLLTPIGWPPWESLQLDGLICNDGSSVRWSRRLEAPGEPGPLELEIPNGLGELSAQLVPDPEARRELVLELDELGLLRTTRAALTDGRGALRGELRAALDGLGPRLARPGTFTWAWRESLDAATYGRWLRTFDVPSAAGMERLRQEALASGLRVSIVTGPRADEPELSAQLPGQVEIVRSSEGATGDLLLPLGPGVRPAPHALATMVSVFRRWPDLTMVHADDDRLDSDGRRTRPNFKPVLGSGAAPQPEHPARARRRPSPGGAAHHWPGRRRRHAVWLGARVHRRISPARVSRLPLVLATLDATAVVDEAGEREALAHHLEAAGTAADVASGLAPGCATFGTASRRGCPG